MSNLPKINTVLYVTDLGKHTRPVFRHALRQACYENADLLMLHVLEPLSTTSRAVIDVYLQDADRERLQEAGMKEVVVTMKDRLKKFCEEEKCSCQLGEFPVKEVLVTIGEPSEEIIRMAKKHNADLIVMGKSTHSLFGSNVMGSTARRVTRHCPIPVLVVPNDD